jgi:hypothetical protein
MGAYRNFPYRAPPPIQELRKILRLVFCSAFGLGGMVQDVCKPESGATVTLGRVGLHCRSMVFFNAGRSRNSLYWKDLHAPGQIGTHGRDDANSCQYGERRGITGETGSLAILRDILKRTWPKLTEYDDSLAPCLGRT